MYEEPEVTWQSGKMALRIETVMKGETPATDRKSDVDMVYEYKLAGAKNNLNVRVQINRVPFLNNNKDFMICLKTEANYQPLTGDMIDISDYDQPPAANGYVEYVMGETSQPNQVIFHWLTVGSSRYQLDPDQTIYISLGVRNS